MKMNNKAQIRKTEEVWMSKLGRLAVFSVSNPEVFWIVKKALRNQGFRRLGAL